MSLAARCVFATSWTAFMPDKSNNKRGPGVAYVLKGFPRLSETFIASESTGWSRKGFAYGLS
jgi:hypothetical protein